jgi:hypothetical protein
MLTGTTLGKGTAEVEVFGVGEVDAVVGAFAEAAGPLTLRG